MNFSSNRFFPTHKCSENGCDRPANSRFVRGVVGVVMHHGANISRMTVV